MLVVFLSSYGFFSSFLLQVDMNIRQVKTPYFNDRKNGIKPHFLILHYTATATGQEVIDDYFCNPNPPNGEVSAHYMVDCDGSITQFVEESKRAYHAGISFWDGQDDLNSHSIGIEIVNPGHDYGYVPFPDAQMDAVVTLCQDILSRHSIPACNVLGHSDIALDRKIDPGELFDWKRMAQEGIGLWPEPLQEDFNKATVAVYNAKRLKNAFADYGYDTKVNIKTLIAQFQRHFHQEIFNEPDKVGKANPETAARLYSLLRMKKDLNAPKA